MHFMSHRFDRKLKKVIMARLWRLPTVGYANDIETGAFEVADTSMAAVDRLYEREPDAQPWVIRIGHRSVFRFGSRSLRNPL
jgi:hypothetical protein